MKIQSPWMGRIKGSAGNMTGCKVYDKNVMRAKAFEVTNPKTSAQQVRREFFSTSLKVSSSVSEEQLRSLFGQKPKAMSRRNELTKQLMDACFAPPQYLMPGNNTIRFVGDSPMDIADALGPNFVPTENDRISSTNGFVVYGDGEWSGSFDSLSPSTNYNYKSAASEPVLLSGSEDYFDFSQLQAIGNGQKVTTPYVRFSNGTSNDIESIDREMLNVDDSQNPNLILVAFDSDKDRIILINTSYEVSSESSTKDLVADLLPNFSGYAYITCDSKGEDVYGRNFGGFIIKTRKEKIGRLSPQVEVIP